MTAIAQDDARSSTSTAALRAAQLTACICAGQDGKDGARDPALATRPHPRHVRDQIARIMKQRRRRDRGQALLRARRVDPIGLRARPRQQAGRRGAQTQGGSTITQQFVKNTYTERRALGAQRKLNEAALAYQLERRWSKEQHPRRVPEQDLLRPRRLRRRGGGPRLLRDARQQPRCCPGRRRCSPRSCKAPSRYDPVEHPKAARERRNLVLDEDDRAGLRLAARAGARRQARRSLPQGPRDRRSRRSRAASRPTSRSYVDASSSARYGERALTAAGCSVYTTHRPARCRSRPRRPCASDARVDAGTRPARSSRSTRAPARCKAMVGGDGLRQAASSTSPRRRPAPAGLGVQAVRARGGARGGHPASTHFTSRQALFDLAQPPALVRHATTRRVYAGLDPAARTRRSCSDNTVYAQLTMTVGPAKVAAKARTRSASRRRSTRACPPIGLGGLRVRRHAARDGPRLRDARQQRRAHGRLACCSTRGRGDPGPDARPDRDRARRASPDGQGRRQHADRQARGRPTTRTRWPRSTRCAACIRVGTGEAPPASRGPPPARPAPRATSRTPGSPA